MTVTTIPFEKRFWAKVLFDDGCWEWTGARWGGYGSIWTGAGQSVTRAHRASYEMLVGPIPEGMVLDHLCRNTGCVRPDHLEAVTDAENTRRGESFAAINARKTHCKRGHELAGDNLKITKNGRGRECRTCGEMMRRAREAKGPRE